MRLRNIPEAKGIVRASRFVLPYGDDELTEGAQIAEALAASKYHIAALSGGRPLAVEIGTGKGGFIIEMARRHPDWVFLGVERYESVLLRAVQKMERGEMTDFPAASSKCAAVPTRDTDSAGTELTPGNLLFLCMDAAQLPDLLPPGSVSCLYLNFSDPWPKARHAKRRLTSPQFLSVYEKFMMPGSELIFKTDNMDLFAFSEESVRDAAHWELLSVTRDLHRDLAPDEENVMTEYERKFSNLGNKICRLVAQYQP